MLARLFKYAVHPGMEDAYRAYLGDVVAVIDHAAHKEGVFEQVFIIEPEQAADWTQGRLFTFRDLAQRDAFAGRMAAQALAYDGGVETQKARKAHAETMRRLTGTQDFRLTPEA